MLPINRLLPGVPLLLAAALMAPRVHALQSDSRGAAGTSSPRAGLPAVRLRSPGAVTMTAEEYRFLELLNHERTARGLVELKAEPLLVEVAREHSREMCEKSYFDHLSPTAGLKTPMERYLHAARRRPAHACVGENLFYCSIVDVDRGHRAFMNSPSHRENILYAPFRRSGIGIYKSDTGEFWVTEMFLTTEG